MLHRLRHRLLGDGVEHHPFHGLLLERLLFLEHFQHVPGDRLALAVGVGGQNQLVGAFERLGDVVEALVRLGVDLPDHAEVGVGVDRAVLGRQVADMAKGRQDLVAGAQILIDRLGLGRRTQQRQYSCKSNGLSAEINVIPGGIDRSLWPEHGEGTPYCQIRVASKTFMNSQFGHERDRRTPEYNPGCVFHNKAIKRLLFKTDCVFSPSGRRAP